MLFNSLSFAIFLPIVFVLYWWAAKKDLKLQNFILLLASYVFYACWDYRFLFLLIFSTALDYFTGIKIHDTSSIKLKKYWLWISICINLGLLCVFKYYNFFVSSFVESFSFVGLKADSLTLNLILPIGISFYTFHGLSYVIDLYKNRIEPERNVINYAVFVGFFPLLVAGPIERATHLLPQIHQKKEFDYLKAVDGLRQILWGVFKKIVIADNCAEFANTIFNNSSIYPGSTLLIGALFFTFQIYGDFSGYSDIALGTARLFGIELIQNFKFPYFSRSIPEFWRRWHISLSSWFRDYLYIPLGGSKGNLWMKIRNVFIVFLVSGFWHGANWTFVVWGGLNAFYMLPSLFLKSQRKELETVAQGRYLPTLKEFIEIGFTFGLVVLAWIFFRADTLQQAVYILSEIFSLSLFTIPQYFLIGKSVKIVCIVLVFVLIEWNGRQDNYAIETLALQWPAIYRWLIYYLIVFAIIHFSGREQQFVYFQF